MPDSSTRVARAGAFAAILVSLALLAGCSQEGSGGSSAAELTARLPSGEGAVHYVDLVGLKVAFGVDLGADPLAAGRDDFGYYALVGEPLPLLSRRFVPELNEALALDDATEVAATTGDDGGVSVIKTDGDLDEIAADLEAIGFELDGDALIRAGAGETAAAVRLEDDLIFLAPSAEQLETIPAEPADPPQPVIEGLTGLAITVLGGDGDCVLSTSAVATADGDGQLIFEIDSGASPNGPQGDDPSGEITIGEPLVDDNLAIVPMSAGELQSAPAQVVLENEYLDYDCDA